MDLADDCRALMVSLVERMQAKGAPKASAELSIPHSGGVWIFLRNGHGAEYSSKDLPSFDGWSDANASARSLDGAIAAAVEAIDGMRPSLKSISDAMAPWFDPRANETAGTTSTRSAAPEPQPSDSAPSSTEPRVMPSESGS